METATHVTGAEIDQLGRLIHDLWPKLNDHDKVRLIEGVQKSIAHVLVDNPELKLRYEALSRQYAAKSR